MGRNLLESYRWDGRLAISEMCLKREDEMDGVFKFESSKVDVFGDGWNFKSPGV